MFNYFKKMRYILNPFLILLMVFYVYAPTLSYAQNPNTNEREGWFFNNTDTAQTGSPTNLKYFRVFELMPEEITMNIFKEQDLSHLSGKKLFVGYGMVDPKDGDCKVFKKEDTGYVNDLTVCLPWWRIEREYVADQTATGASMQDEILKEIRSNTRPPMMYKTCKTWSDGKVYPGGKTTCTSYYDRLLGPSCWDNPKQAGCFVDNCGQNIKDFCTYIDSAVGDKTTLETAAMDGTDVPQASSTKINLASHQYNCPAGPLVEEVKCLDEESAVIYPQKCNDDTYEYCDERRPTFDSNGNLISYEGTCTDGTPITCEANKFNNTTKICKVPLYETFTNTSIENATLTRDYTTVEVDVLSGEEDIYMAQDNCLRANTVQDARNQELHVKIMGDGYLDDDIYVLRHRENGSHSKIYCNMQHNENKNSRKNYNGDVLQCIDNDGNYAFNQTVPIEVTDIVTVQQNSENENQTGVPFALGRNHYGSTKLYIDGIEVAPSTFGSDFPYYPKNGGWLRTWDNTTSTFSILFPFAGAYDIRFYNKYNQEVSKAILGIEDFKELSAGASLQLKLGKTMQLAPGITDDIEHEDGTITLGANRNDTWVEWGGGVFGGKNSVTGQSSDAPRDSYVKENAVYNVIVKDLITGAITPIPLVYPLPYPNRVFISKLKVYEKRKYRCYNEFSTPSFLLSGSEEVKQVCSTNQNYLDYQNGINDNVSLIPKWEDTTICEQNCREYTPCTEENINDSLAYKCVPRGGEDLGGDLGGNLFSSEAQCGERCFTQNPCNSFTDNKCIKVEEKLGEPVSDINGKTVFRKKEVAYRCEDNVQKQVDCLEWEVSNNVGDSTLYNQDIGYETFDFSANFEKAVTHAANLEVGLLHIWSGWRGECVYGKKWDSSYLSDPMTIISYAMMAYSAYSSYASSATTTTTSSTTTAAGESTTTITSTTGNTTTTTVYAENGDMIGDTLVTQEATFGEQFFGGVDNYLGTNTTSAYDWYNTTAIGSQGSIVNITNGDLINFGLKSAMILAAPPPESYTMARKLMRGFYGARQDDEAIIAYNSCMASIGLAVPNLIAWVADEKGDEGLYPQLKEPWKHPIRVTTSQIATMASLSGSQYVMDHYLMLDDGSDFLTSLIALTPDAYTKAGEMLCMGANTYKAKEHINHHDSKHAGSSGGGGGIGAMQIAMMAIGYFFPIAGLILTVVMDFMSNMWAKIDTCNDEEDAMQRDILHYQTLKFNKQEQCTFVKTFCDKEASFFGKKKCVRERDEFCCYDMVLTRVFAEGMKEQLDKPYLVNDKVVCNDLTINDLKEISFTECLPGQNPKINKCMPIDKYSEFEQVLFRQATKKLDKSVSKGLTEQVINSMAIIGSE